MGGPCELDPYRDLRWRLCEGNRRSAHSTRSARPSITKSPGIPAAASPHWQPPAGAAASGLPAALSLVLALSLRPASGAGASGLPGRSFPPTSRAPSPPGWQPGTGVFRQVCDESQVSVVQGFLSSHCQALRQQPVTVAKAQVPPAPQVSVVQGLPSSQSPSTLQQPAIPVCWQRWVAVLQESLVQMLGSAHCESVVQHPPMLV